MIKFSIIIPVYNRSDEVAELLASLTQQTYRDYEIIIVEDGSSVPCETVVKQYAYRLPVNYYMKPNSGPGQSRNYGAERAKGEYLLIWDSDILIPQGYFEAIETFLQTNPVDAFVAKISTLAIVSSKPVTRQPLSLMRTSITSAVRTSGNSSVRSITQVSRASTCLSYIPVRSNRYMPCRHCSLWR